MATELGALLVTCGLAPLARAASHFCAGRVREGLDAIQEKELLEGLERGAAAVASRAGVRTADVMSLLPWDSLRPALATLREHHAAADAIWREQGHALGGFLAGVAEVTVDAERMDDAGFYLDRLADKLSRDKKLSGPLDDLAADVTRWEGLVRGLGPLLDEGKALRAAYLKKQVRRAAAAVTLLVILAGLGAYGLSLHRARARVEASLTTEDPCAAAAIAPADLSRASAGQLARVDEREAACEARRERAAYEERCLRAAEHAEAGTIDEADREVIGASAELLVRAKGGALTTEDLLATPTFPCEDLGVPARLWAVFARAAANAPPAWRKARGVSDALAERLKGELAPSPASALAIASEVEPIAERAVKMGQVTDVDEARDRCALQARLGLPQGKWCTALGVALSRGAPRP